MKCRDGCGQLYQKTVEAWGNIDLPAAIEAALHWSWKKQLKSIRVVSEDCAAVISDRRSAISGEHISTVVRNKYVRGSAEQMWSSIGLAVHAIRSQFSAMDALVIIKRYFTLYQYAADKEERPHNNLQSPSVKQYGDVD
ncbi:7561_t:CDS:2 [Paraglomus occultum]|uniref:7561_t:CDS:1 n=1 Tax=Paraglomus occultum TaxID=144539 RepID=A0A9N9FAF4_9GLOM|nr:7561_t:CDS:2 [Paraglomus occultum]